MLFSLFDLDVGLLTLLFPKCLAIQMSERKKGDISELFLLSQWKLPVETAHVVLLGDIQGILHGFNPRQLLLLFSNFFHLLPEIRECQRQVHKEDI